MSQVQSILNRFGRDSGSLLDIIREVQSREAGLSSSAVEEIARELKISPVDVQGVVSFYHFFSSRPRGKYTVFLNNSITSVFKGQAAVARAFERETGGHFGGVTPDGLIGLFETSCIGMNDQEPSAIINGVVFTRLDERKVSALVEAMKAGREIGDMVTALGDGANQSDLIRAMVANNIRRPGPVLLAPWTPGAALSKALTLKPEAVIEEIKKSNLLGRGGAGFPTGLKWDFCRKEKGAAHYVVCNADEGEPGTFKDRVLLTERPRLLFEGMAVAGYAVGAESGLLYLRAEYEYLKAHLESVLDDMRGLGLLGKNAGGRTGFHFDVQIKLGAGAYVCGEESALLESAEGKRGEPRDRPPFPVAYGYRGCPTAVNNVETLCAAARILAQGADWFRSLGTSKSSGTKLLSVSGDCERPGVYEFAFGLSVRELLEEVGGRDAQAVQVGGPSGNCIAPGAYDRKLCFSDLPTGGSVIVIGPRRDLLEVVHNFMEFFVEESCGWCTPCRAGNVQLKAKLEKIMKGLGTVQDLKDIQDWGRIIKAASRCGLGQTSPNPLLTTLHSFPEIYQKSILQGVDYRTEFDLAAAVAEGAALTGRKVRIEEDHR